MADLAVTVSPVDGVPKVWTTSRTSEEFAQLHEHLAPMADTPLPHPPWTDRAHRGWSMLRDIVSSRAARVPTATELNEYVSSSSNLFELFLFSFPMNRRASFVFVECVVANSSSFVSTRQYGVTRTSTLSLVFLRTLILL